MKVLKLQVDKCIDSKTSAMDLEELNPGTEIQEPGIRLSFKNDSIAIAGEHVHADPLPTEKEFACDVLNGILNGKWQAIKMLAKNDWQFLVARRTELRRMALTGRELDVVMRVVKGLSNKHIAIDTGLTESSVATYLKRALTKLNLSTRADLIKSIPAWLFDVLP